MPSTRPRAGDWLALYGSLMRGLGAMEELGIVDGLRFAGPCRCSGELFDLGDYPGMRPGSASVFGELYAILDAGVLDLLDAFEEYDPAAPRSSIYLRERIELVEPRDTLAWIYVYNRVPDAGQRIPSGDWRAHIAKRRAAEGA